MNLKGAGTLRNIEHRKEGGNGGMFWRRKRDFPPHSQIVRYSNEISTRGRGGYSSMKGAEEPSVHPSGEAALGENT